MGFVMSGSGYESPSKFSMGKTKQDGECYLVPQSYQPDLNCETAEVPTIDLSRLKQNPVQRSPVVESIGNACRRFGFFQVINHGICQSILDEALCSAFEFFNLPAKEKARFMSTDVHEPVRYGTSLKDGVEKVQYWRLFLKHYAHPLADWIKLWPNNPPNYRDKMGRYALEVQKLAIEITDAITESLGISPAYLSDKMEEGMQVMVVNFYPPCPNPSLVLGLPPHSDYSCLTILLQSSSGLEIMSPEDGTWRAVSDIQGALQVHVGDHIEVLSNGLYKSVVHRATLNSERTRVSIASLHSLGMDENMETAKELVDEEHPKGYKKSSFRDFLNFLSINDVSQGKSFINTLKVNNM